MPAFGFKARFRDPIRSGLKTHTIRAAVPRGYQVDAWAPLYSGMRTTSCELIGSGRMGAPVEIRLDFDADPCIEAEAIGLRVFARDAGKILPARKRDDFAVLDGFADWAEMEAFWAAEHPGVRQFTGWLLPWTDFTLEHRLGAA